MRIYLEKRKPAETNDQKPRKTRRKKTSGAAKN